MISSTPPELLACEAEARDSPAMAGAVGKNRERATGMIWGQNGERERERERERECGWSKGWGPFCKCRCPFQGKDPTWPVPRWPKRQQRGSMDLRRTT